MKKALLLLLGWLVFFQSSNAQIENSDLILFGVERVSGNFTGVSPYSVPPANIDRSEA